MPEAEDMEVKVLTMIYVGHALTFDALREANMLRLPVFKNCHGGAAHSKRDGSDWSPAQWVQAIMGELGEFASVRLKYEYGEITREQFEEATSKELADVQTYLDLLARRALDVPTSDTASVSEWDPAIILLKIIAHLGEYANARKKFERGDFTAEEFRESALPNLNKVKETLGTLITSARGPWSPLRTDYEPHPTGVDLGMATVAKWNEVSERVGCDIHLVVKMG